MDKALLHQAVNSLKQNKVSFSFDTHLYAGGSFVRGMFFYDIDDGSKIKSSLSGDFLKKSKLQKTLTWYLGDRRKVFYLKFKDEISMEISELEKFNVNNYS